MNVCLHRDSDRDYIILSIMDIRGRWVWRAAFYESGVVNTKGWDFLPDVQPDWELET